MASIVKRKKKYSVVYSYTDENGKEHKKWETFESNAEAKHRKAEIEFEKANGTLKGPSAKTVRELLDLSFSMHLSGHCPFAITGKLGIRISKCCFPLPASRASVYTAA